MTTLPGPTLSARDGAWQVADHGAQVLAWQPDGHRPVIWFNPERPAVKPDVIVGGIPVCTPWFGHGPDGDQDPQHGPARTLDFTRTEATADDERLHAVLETSAEGIVVRHEVTMTGQSLDLAATLTNDTDSARRVELMWHSYLRVGDSMGCRVTGLDGATWWNTVDDSRGECQDGTLALAPATDTVVQGVGDRVGLVDPAWGRTIRLGTEGCPTVVVWNPHREDRPTGTDPSSQAWRDFVCVETGFAKDHALTLDPGSSLTVRTTMEVEPLSS